MKVHRLALTAVAALLLGACGDGGPEGPGPARVALEAGGVQIGAVVIQLNGTGIGAVSGTGSAEAFAAAAPASQKRVVLVSESGGVMGFTVQLEDRSLALPTATVVEAIDTGNEPVTDLGGVTVRVELAQNQ